MVDLKGMGTPIIIGKLRGPHLGNSWPEKGLKGQWCVNSLEKIRPFFVVCHQVNGLISIGKNKHFG